MADRQWLDKPDTTPHLNLEWPGALDVLSLKMQDIRRYSDRFIRGVSDMRHEATIKRSIRPATLVLDITDEQRRYLEKQIESIGEALAIIRLRFLR